MELFRDAIIQGDVIEKLRELPDNLVDCVVTSPPYWGLRDYGVSGQIGLEEHPQKYVDKITEVFHEVQRVLKRTGTVFLNLGDTYFGGGRGQEFTEGDKQGTNRGSASYASIPAWKPDGSTWLRRKQKLLIPERVAIAMQDDGWLLRNSIIWNKINGMPESVTDRLKRSYETVFFFVKSEKYYFNLNAIRRPYPKETIERCQRGYLSDNKVVNGNYDTAKHIRWAEKVTTRVKENVEFFNKKGSGGNYTYGGLDSPDGSHQNVNGANPGDVWNLTTESFKGAHFATFPTKLVRQCVKCGCPDNGLVMDIFSGSGTTLLVARRMGRHYLGIELNPKYVEMTKRRLIKNRIIPVHPAQMELTNLLACKSDKI